jgi:hypothetical protein
VDSGPHRRSSGEPAEVPTSASTSAKSEALPVASVRGTVGREGGGLRHARVVGVGGARGDSAEALVTLDWIVVIVAACAEGSHFSPRRRYGK